MEQRTQWGVIERKHGTLRSGEIRTHVHHHPSFLFSMEETKELLPWVMVLMEARQNSATLSTLYIASERLLEEQLRYHFRLQSTGDS